MCHEPRRGICFSGTQGDKSVFEDLFVRFNHFLEYFIGLVNIPTYIFKSEFKSRLPNRIRTYKGILPKEIEVSTYYQEECNLSNKNSIIAGVVNLNENNISTCNELFYDSDTSFIIISRRSILSRDFVNDVVQNKMIHKNNSFLNYTKVLSDYCSKGDIIIRMGGDGGDRYIALQIFFAQNCAELPL